MDMLTLTPEIAVTLGLICCVFYLFFSEKFSIDICAIIVLVVLGLLSEFPFLEPLVLPSQLFSGFSSSAVIAIIALMIMAAGIERSGAMNALTRQILRLSGNSETRLIFYLCLTAGLLSSVIQNIAVVAMFIPVASYLQFHGNIPVSRTLMPLGFCVMLGGNLTLLGNGSLIILNEMLLSLNVFEVANPSVTDISEEAVGMFELAPLGMGLLALGLIFFSSPWGRSWFRDVGGSEYRKSGSTLLSHLQLELDYIRLPEQSMWVGKEVIDFEDQYDVLVLAMAGEGLPVLTPLRDTLLKADTRLVILGDNQSLQSIIKNDHVQNSDAKPRFGEFFQQHGAGYSEVVLSSKSPLLEKTIHDVYFRTQFGLTPIAIQRGDQKITGPEINYMALKAGDLLVVHGGRQAVNRLRQSGELVMVTSECPELSVDSSHAIQAIAWLLLSLTLILVLQLPVGLCLWLGVLGMFLSGVIPPHQAYQAVSWRTVVMLAGLIPLGIAVEQTGTAAWLSYWALQGLPDHPMVLQLVVALTTSLLTLVISNVGTTILLLPVAVNLAVQMGQDPLFYALIVAVMSSNSFVIPTHQANALIYSTGQYKIKQFLQVGGILTAIYLVHGLLLLNYLY